jgi:putative ABC transport system permease protein
MRIPLLEGRLLNEHDTHENPVMVVISRAAAEYYWPRRSAVGAYARLGVATGDRVQIVGVVADTRNDGLAKPPKPEIYFSNAIFALQRMHFMVRSARPEILLVPEIRKAIESVNAAQPIHDVQSMRDVVGGFLSLERVSSLLTGFFALAALLMATLGVYGVVACAVRHRTVEIGTRMALGAVRRDLLSVVIGGGLKMALYGVVLGLAALAFVPRAERRCSAVYLFDRASCRRSCTGFLHSRVARNAVVADGRHPQRARFDVANQNAAAAGE